MENIFVWRVTYICVHVTQAQFLPTSSKHVSPGMRFLGLGIGGLSHQSCMSLHIGTNNNVGGSIKTNKLEMNRGHKMHLKRNRAESLGYHDRHPLPRVCLRELGSRDVINWQWLYVIRAQMICYRNNRYLHETWRPRVSPCEKLSNTVRTTYPGDQ